MKNLLFLLLPVFTFAQNREEKPLPIIAKEPTGSLEENITGWSYSLDRQWVSAENIIPVRAVSRDKNIYKSHENELGLDNLKMLQAYPVKYGEKTLLLLVKFFKTGDYKSPATQSGWKTQLNAYYYLIPFDELKQLSELPDGQEKKIVIEMIHGGLVSDIKTSEALDEIEEKLIVKDSYDRNMILQLRPFQEKNIVQFQLYSLHEIFSDVEGVAHDFTLNGKSVYGSPVLLDYIYYETSLDNFKNTFSLDTNVEFRGKK